MGGKSIIRFNRTVTLWKSKKIREIARGSRRNVFVKIRQMPKKMVTHNAVALLNQFSFWQFIFAWLNGKNN